MTSRTIDIRCNACGNYLFSLMPNDSKRIAMDHYCKKKTCQMQATVDKLKKES